MDKVHSAAELEKMTPAERQVLFAASIITDLDDAPPELLARTRSRMNERIASEPTRPR